MENDIKITKLEEQMKQVNEKLDDLNIKIESEFRELKDEMKCFVRKEEFYPVRSVVYGMIGMILVAFLSGLIYIVFK